MGPLNTVPSQNGHTYAFAATFLISATFLGDEKPVNVNIAAKAITDRKTKYKMNFFIKKDINDNKLIPKY